MYESPITLIETQMRMAKENSIYQAVCEVGVDVDKEELIKALKYDRDQYDKGYKNGYEEAIKEFAERLKDKIFNAIECDWREEGGYHLAIDVCSDIDNLVKKMTEEI